MSALALHLLEMPQKLEKVNIGKNSQICFSYLLLPLAALDFVNIWPHLQHTLGFRTAISVVACYKNVVAEWDNTFRALLGDG